jgi:hypothetical protein
MLHDIKLGFNLYYIWLYIAIYGQFSTSPILIYVIDIKAIYGLYHLIEVYYWMSLYMVIVVTSMKLH